MERKRDRTRQGEKRERERREKGTDGWMDGGREERKKKGEEGGRRISKDR